MFMNYVYPPIMERSDLHTENFIFSENIFKGGHTTTITEGKITGYLTKCPLGAHHYPKGGITVESTNRKCTTFSCETNMLRLKRRLFQDYLSKALL